MTSEAKADKAGRRPRLIRSWRIFVFLILVAALVPIAYAGWSELYVNFLEHGTPVIAEVGQFPRGIGVAPVTVRWRLADNGAGLDEVVVRTQQRGSSKEILRQKLERRPQADIELKFDGQESELEEGQVDIVIRAFDASFWSNGSEKIYSLMVDFRKPRVSVITTQHNASQGGSQLIFYEAYDENLAVSGVKIGRHTFPGYSAKVLDPAFADYKDVYACIYAVESSADPETVQPKVFAEDVVGNARSTSFYNKIFRQSYATLRVNLNERFLRSQVSALAENNLATLEQMAKETGQPFRLTSPQGSDERMMEQFRLVNEMLRQRNYNEVEAKLKNRGRFEKLWLQEFSRPAGVPRSEYGHTLNFSYQGRPLGSLFQQGFEILTAGTDKKVTASNSGVVAFSEHLGVYGRVVAIDHGMGVFSLYGHLDSAAVSPGDAVDAGKVIGFAGDSGFALGTGVQFEMWVQNVPVNPREWWDAKWYYAHITEKIAVAKKVLGIPVYSPFER